MQERRIGLEVRMFSNLINRKINTMVAEEEENLTGHQNRVLRFLMENRDTDIMQRDIEKHFAIRRSTASHMLQLMEKNGYIVRTASTKDARMKKISMTEKGVEAYQRMGERLTRFEKLLQQDITDEELETFLDIMRRMEKNIN